MRPRVCRGIFVDDVDWFVSGSLGPWLTWTSSNLGTTMVSLVLEQTKGTVVTVIPVWTVDSVGVLESRVLPVPLVSVGPVDSGVYVVVVVSVESVASNYSSRW